MPRRPWHFGGCVFVAIAIGMLPIDARAQKAETPAAPATDKVSPGEVLPRVYELKDKNGESQTILGFTFEDFMEMARLKNQLAGQNQQPGAIIQDLTIDAVALPGRVELTARYSITVHASEWERVGLRLPSAVLREQPTYKGPGEHFMRPDPEHEGYFVWIRAKPGTTHDITLKLLAPLTQIGPETHLRLTVPRALVSQLQLQVPLEHAVVKVSEGTTLESVRGIAGGKTEIKVPGIGGEFEVSWHAAESQVAELPTMLEASGVQTIRVSGRNISAEARLTVRSFGGEFDHFQVRLPPGAEYVGNMQAGTSLVSVDGTSAKGKLYEVRLEKKSAGPVEVRLLTERAAGSQQADDMLELAGFEVPGAVRQWGTIAVLVEGNLQTVWGPSDHVRPIDELGAPMRLEGLAAGFEYFVQPYSLTARFVPQKTHVRVEPQYVLLVSSDEAQLRGKLKYTVRGAKVRALELEAPDWEFDQIGPDGLVNVDGAVTGETSPLVIPLVQPTSGEIEISFEAHRKLTSSGPVELELPRLRGDAVAPANLAVVPADNVELAWQADKSVALAPQTVRPQLKLPERQQDPLLFRADGTGAKFVVAMNVHEQAISTSLATQLEIDEREARIEQRMTFQIAYEPTDHLTLNVPRTIRADRLNITLDGQRLLPASLGERSGGEAGEMVPVRLTLPAARIGRCELLITYVTRHDRRPTAQGTPITVALVIPGEGHLTSNELSIVPAAGISVAYPTGPWSEESRDTTAAGAAAMTLSARRALAEVALTVAAKERPAENLTTIDRAWIQTRMTDAQRVDHAAFRFTTSEPRLALVLPDGADAASLTVDIDARRATWELGRQNELIVNVPAASQSPHAMELRYHFAERQPTGHAVLDAPYIKSATWVQQLEWQLVLPANEHVLTAPTHYTGEFTWVRGDVFWHREPTMDQQELESWVGAGPSEDPRLANETDEQYAARQRAFERATNRYLFSAVGNIAPLDFYSVSRARLVLIGSLPLLMAGLMLIYFPWTRRPGVLFALAVLVVAVSMTDPDSALLLAQGSTLGIVLAIVAAVLARVSARPVSATVPVRGSSRALERSVTEMYQRPPAHGSQPSTATNPLLPGSTPELET